MKFRIHPLLALFAVLASLFLGVPAVRGETMVQYFNTGWNEIALKMPELAEAGYDAIWVPPPTKGSGGLSVGYDMFDPFDLGSKDQRNSVSTRYGTEAEFLRLVEIAHRFGIRVYLDTIVNHRAFDVPGFNEFTPVDIYPGLVPEDFHLRITQDGFYRKWDNTRNWNDAWQVQHLGLADLADIAQEPGVTNENFGLTEGSTAPKIKFVRDPQHPEYYCYLPDGTYVGFGPANGITAATLAANPNFYGEYVQDYLNRSGRWLIDRTKADGLRLDAVKHVRADFFGATFGADKDTNDYGYTGQVQRQFNLTRGFSDANHRDSVFDTERPRDDAMMFGEHLGEPPSYGEYVNAGMRLVDNVLRNNLNSILGNPSTGLSGLDVPGSYGFDASQAVMHAQSHDNDYAARRELQHALYFTRAGIGLVYTDGNHQAQTLSQSGGAFPRHANTSFLGQFGDNRIPNLLNIHEQFARGSQAGVWSDTDLVAYERRDKRENGAMTDADGTTMILLLNDNYANGQRPFDRATFKSSFAPGAYLWQYARGPASSGDSMAGFYVTMNDAGGGQSYFPSSVTVPRGGYYVFSWKNPDPADGWQNGGGRAVTILQNGAPAALLTVTRQDGPDGDPAFSGDGLPDASKPILVANTNVTDYKYQAKIPVITDGSAVRFVARTDGSAENVLLKLDGGMDLNGINHALGDPRDNPPAIATDTFLGYEQPSFVSRIHPELFAAMNTGANNTTGSPGADIYTGTGVAAGDFGSGVKTLDADTATFHYHNPTAGVGNISPARNQYDASRAQLWSKVNSVGAGYKMFLYYTDGTTNPEGAGGFGIGATKVVELHYDHVDDGGSTNWWQCALPGDFTATSRYKIGAYKDAAPSWFPGGAASAARKLKMMTTFQTMPLNFATMSYRPHNDYGEIRTGLAEGYHVIRARAFLKRDGRSSIYNTFTQTFYYDAQLPGGEIKFPANNGDTVGGQQYGAVVRTDATVTEVWYKIVDGDPANDDSATAVANGNNAWVKAKSLTPTLGVTSAFPNEWRFNFVNIPATGTAQILVRLREASSADSTQFAATASAADDTAKHYTTLVRSVNTAGPTTKIFTAFPQSDGQTVDSNYVMKVWFTKSLADGLTTTQLINRLLIKIASSESGSAAGGVAQDRSKYAIHYNVTGEYHELAYQLPDLYNDQSDFLHTIVVTYAGATTLETRRLVLAQKGNVIRDTIVTPPEVDSDGKTYQIVLPDVASPTAAQRSVPIRVETDATATGVTIAFSIGNVPAGNIVAAAGNPTVNGGIKFWDFTWMNVQAGDFRFTSSVDINGDTIADAVAERNAHIVFRQMVTTAVKGDTDDDGLSDIIEGSSKALPTTNSETWTNGQVHLWRISGITLPLVPDTDGDGLGDGLELGWATAIGDTNPATDTNGDGVPNFQPDLDPPIFNTLDNQTAPAGYELFNPWPFNLNKSRTDQIAGTMTDPNKPDTDDDGLNDGIEDLRYLVVTNPDTTITLKPLHFGRVDIGLLDGSGNITSIVKHPPTIYNTSRVDRSKLPANAIFLTTDPNNPDTDGDGISDGTEDANHNGRVDLAIVDRDQVDAQGNFIVLGALDDTNALGFGKFHDYCYTFTDTTVTPNRSYVWNRIDRAKLNAAFPRVPSSGTYAGHHIDVIWLETDPLDFSTTRDGLPDGWKVGHGFDPFDDGVIGHKNLHTGKIIATNVNGVAGDADSDGFSNQQEYINNTDPRVADTGVPPPPGAIRIGPNNAITVGAVTNSREFTDWTISDLIALDPYDGDGTNNQQSDIYHANDGFDSSRDLVAFYAHDGGAVAQGGDGKFYFRTDMHDLKAYAEEGKLDIYVAINFGNPGTGEFNLPDQIDTGTAMGWQAVVACYSTNVGRVYVASPTSPTQIGQELTQFGVTIRDQNSAEGFKRSYYSSDLDAVEFSISRQALLDAGWNGLNAADLIYQVFTTKDGTANSPVGAGDIGGRSDIRDSIRNDWIASDYYADQANIKGSNSVLRAWVGLSGDNDRFKRVKVVSLIHEARPIMAGSETQALINNGAGGGFYRPLDVHQAYGVPLALHIPATLASAFQWAKADPAANKPWRDGPAFNARLASLSASGVVQFTGTTFSDHILPYFPQAFTNDNVALANDFYAGIYGSAPSSQVLYPPERVLNSAALGIVQGAGFGWTFADQMRHITKWFGRTSALGNDGYRINQINGAKVFVINDQASTFRFQNNDGGLNMPLRELLSRKARSAQQDQVVVLASDWSDFTSKANADAYDANIRWMASRPWIQIVTPQQIAAGTVDGGATGAGTTWGVVNRGTNTALATVAKDYVDHATEENYDNWFNGAAGLEEGLAPKIFNRRPLSPLPSAFGRVGVSGIADSAWSQLSNVSVNFPGLQTLARGGFHGSMYLSAFHNQANGDLSKFSTGAYIYPDISYQTMAGFSRSAQAQVRWAAVYARVSQWAASANAGSYNSTAVAEAADVDLDGENEYLIYNARVFAVFEAIGGRLTAAWVRDISSGKNFQTVGNPLSYAGFDDETEGAANVIAGAIGSYRTSGFKDWFAAGPNSIGYNNDLYVATSAPTGTGWRFTSSDGKIVKTITLAPVGNSLAANYALSGGVTTLYVRHGMSPHLLDLLKRGQAGLGDVSSIGGFVNSQNAGADGTVRNYLRIGSGGFGGATYNATAVDSDAAQGVTFDTVKMRNQAQTQQIELAVTNGATFSLGFETGPTLSLSTAGDGLPDSWIAANSVTGGAAADNDGDGLTNLQEFIFGKNPRVPDRFQPLVAKNGTGYDVTFGTIPDRFYRVFYSDNLQTWNPLGADILGDGAGHLRTDDGSASSPAPGSVPRRFYRIEVRLTNP